MTAYIIALMACFFLSAFFSASEMSLSAANRLRLEGMAEDGDRRAALTLELLEHFDRALGAILIGNNLVNVAASSLSSVIALAVAVKTGVADGLCTTVATVLVTIIVIIFGETIPKILAKKNANRLSVLLAGPVYWLTMLLRPLVWCAVGLTNLITRFLPAPEGDTDQEAAVEELQSIIETAEDEEVIDEDRSELLQAALDFSDVSASQVMTARVDMEAIDIDDDWEDILRQANETLCSRLPVYEGDTDNIIGILHLNALYRALLEKDGPVDIRPLLSEPCWIYKTVKLPAVLEELKQRKTHMAIVTDEYGGTAGVITMEDVLESLVGDIWDETDEVEPEVIETAEGSWELDGDLPIDQMLELVGLPPEDFDFASETVGGWVMELLEGFAAPGDQLTYENLSLTVLETDDKRVQKVRVTKI
jgi:CBS domain containing-hemolysin-like protein